jgi:hypothetical protein
VEFEFLVPSESNPGLFYIINTAIGVCTCSVNISGGPCKHQRAIAIKFHIAMLSHIINLLSLFLGQLAENNSFYASLRAKLASQDQEPIIISSSSFFNNGITEWRFVFREVGIIQHIYAIISY